MPRAKKNAPQSGPPLLGVNPIVALLHDDEQAPLDAPSSEASPEEFIRWYARSIAEKKIEPITLDDFVKSAGELGLDGRWHKRMVADLIASTIHRRPMHNDQIAALMEVTVQFCACVDALADAPPQTRRTALEAIYYLLQIVDRLHPSEPALADVLRQAAVRGGKKGSQWRVMGAEKRRKKIVELANSLPEKTAPLDALADAIKDRWDHRRDKIEFDTIKNHVRAARKAGQIPPRQVKQI